MTIVFWQRYPSDDISERAFTSDFDAQCFLRIKEEDYRYTVGQVWSKKFVEVTDSAPPEAPEEK